MGGWISEQPEVGSWRPVSLARKEFSAGGKEKCWGWESLKKAHNEVLKEPMRGSSKGLKGTNVVPFLGTKWGKGLLGVTGGDLSGVRRNDKNSRGSTKKGVVAGDAHLNFMDEGERDGNLDKSKGSKKEASGAIWLPAREFLGEGGWAMGERH